MNNRFLWLIDWWPFKPSKNMDLNIYKEGPKDKFHCVTLATQQEIGLFILKSLPRNG